MCLTYYNELWITLYIQAGRLRVTKFAPAGFFLLFAIVPLESADRVGEGKTFINQGMLNDQQFLNYTE